jgi:hypothetical protein
MTIMADTDLRQLFWLAFDRLDYWLIQARLWLADVVYSPLSDRDVSD